MKHDKHQIIDAFRTLEEISASLTKEHELQYTRLSKTRIRIEIHRMKRRGFSALAYTRTIEVDAELEETLFQTWKEIVVRGMTCSSFMLPPQP